MSGMSFTALQAELVAELKEIKDEMLERAKAIPALRKFNSTDDAQTKELANMINGGRLINEPVVHNTPDIIDLIINRINDRTAFQSSRELVGVLQRSFNQQAQLFLAETNPAPKTGIKKALNAITPKKLSNMWDAKRINAAVEKAALYKTYAERLGKIEQKL